MPFFDIDVKEKSALSLAFLGDGVFEIYVRSYVLSQCDGSVDSLSKKTREYVNARSQAKMYFFLADHLNPDELAVMKRGRNTKTYTTAKNASVTDYRHATGLEALFGYLFLKGDSQRLFEIFKICIEALSIPLEET